MRTMTAERARELVRYEPETGEFYYTKRMSNFCRKDGRAGTTGQRGVRIIRLEGKTYLAHRVAVLLMTGQWPVHEVDHIDGNPGNNRWENLRDIPHKNNVYNMRHTPSHKKYSALMGAQWCQQGKLWKSSICIDGKVVRLGVFESAEAASAAYLKAKRALHPGFML